MKTVEESKTSVAYSSAVQFIHEGKLDNAVDLLSGYLEKFCEENDPMHVSLAPFYFLYGSACLSQVEANSNVFGESVKRKDEIEELDNIAATNDINNKQEVSQSSTSTKMLPENNAEPNSTELDEPDQLDLIISGLVEEYKSKNSEDPSEEVVKQWIDTIKAATDEANQNTENTEPVSPQQVLCSTDVEDLLSLSWDCLETARVIYSKILENETDAGDEIKSDLCEIQLKLGELCMETGNAEGAVSEYTKSLDILKTIKNEENVMAVVFRKRRVAQILTLLAGAYLFASAEDSPEETTEAVKASILDYSSKAVEKKVKSAEKYYEAMQVLVRALQAMLVCSTDFKEISQSFKVDSESVTAANSSLDDSKNNEVILLNLSATSVELTEKVTSIEAKISATGIKTELAKDIIDIAELIQELKLKLDDVLSVVNQVPEEGTQVEYSSQNSTTTTSFPKPSVNSASANVLSVKKKRPLNENKENDDINKKAKVVE